MTETMGPEQVTTRTVRKWGCIAVLLMIPADIIVSHFVDPGRGMAAGVSLAFMIVAVRAFWYLRRHAWFWMAVGVLTIIHVVLIIVVPWPDKGFSGPVLWPVGIAEFAFVFGFLTLVEKVMSRGDGASSRT